MKYFRLWWNSIRRRYYNWLINENHMYLRRIQALYKEAVSHADAIRRRQVAKFEKRHARYNQKLKALGNE